jgi:hypothetical protein
MLEIILVGSFFFGNEPEQILFMLYTMLFIWGAAMRAVSFPLFAPHILEVVAAARAAEAATSTCGTAGATACSSATTTVAPEILSKYCGKTVGEIASTCGISLALSAYFDPRRLRVLPRVWMDKDTKRKIHKKLRLTFSYVLGVAVNMIADVEDWWAAFSFYKKDSSSSGAATAAADL